MTDLYRGAYEYWFADSCRRPELIGGITACVEATQPDRSTLRLTPGEAITRIAGLLAEYDAEKAQQPGGGR